MFPLAYKRNTRGNQLIDRSKATQVSTFASPSLNTTYQSILSLNGKGYLETFIMNGNANVTSVRITVDGVVKFEGSSNLAGNVTGVVIKSLITAIGGNIAPAVQAPSSIASFFGFNSVLVGYPYTTNTTQNGTLCVTTDSIHFKNSLLIEAKLGASTASIPYYVAGGVI